MNTVTFKNGKVYETVSVYGGKETYQEAKRDTLDIVIASELITLDEAKAIWQDTDATSEITIAYDEVVNDETVEKTGVHLNYTLPMELKVDQTGVHIKLAQKSALEIAVEKQGQDIKDNEAALCELAEMLAGGNE